MITAQEAAARAVQLRDLGRLDDAERVLRSALSQDPSDGELLLMLAAVLLSARRFDEGLAASAGALAAAPDDERGHRIRALLLSGQGRHREAVESGYRAVTLAPESAAAALAYSIVLQQAGRLADAARRRAVWLACSSGGRRHIRWTTCQATRDGPPGRARRTLRLYPSRRGPADLAVLDGRQPSTGRALAGW